MGQLYRWVEKHTGKIVYVGQVAGGTITDIYNRVKAERNQFPWTKEREYIVQYLSGKMLGRNDFNKNETTALETHFINLYQTGKNGYNRNYQITGGTMNFVPVFYESAWEDLPPLTRRSCVNYMEPPYDKIKLIKVRESFIRNGEKFLELQEIFFCVLFDYVNGLICNGLITVYCNKYLNFTSGVVFNGRYYDFFKGTAKTCDTDFVRCIDGKPIEPEIYHWTGELSPNAVSNLIECKPYLDDLYEKVMTAKNILEQYNPDLISNLKGGRFQRVYAGLKDESKYNIIEKLIQKAANKIMG